MSGRRRRIDREAMYGLLIEALPTLADHWREQTVSWAGDPRALPDFPSLHTIASFAIAELRAGNRAIVDVAARVMRDGDAIARELMQVGILDDMKSVFPGDSEVHAVPANEKRRRRT